MKKTILILCIAVISLMASAQTTMWVIDKVILKDTLGETISRLNVPERYGMVMDLEKGTISIQNAARSKYYLLELEDNFEKDGVYYTAISAMDEEDIRCYIHIALYQAGTDVRIMVGAVYSDGKIIWYGMQYVGSKERKVSKELKIEM